MRLSVIDPVSPAIEQTKEILFRPFDLGKWLRLGFCAFLMNLTSGNGGGGGGSNSSGGGARNQPGEDPVLAWIEDNLLLTFIIATMAVAVIIAIVLVLTWLSSRGHFMFIDGVVQNRGAVVQPWREFRPEGNSLFWVRFWMAWAGLTTVMAVALFAGMLALPDIMEGEFRLGAMAAIAFGGTSFFLLVFLFGFILMVLADFVVPIMYLRRVTAIQALQVWHRELFVGHFGAYVRYFLFKIVIAICLGVISILAVCGTCCLALLPYIGTVILLPVIVFDRCYSILFIEQYGPGWAIFPPYEELSPID